MRPAWAAQLLYQETVTQTEKEEKRETGKGRTEEAEGDTCSRQPLKSVGISSNPVWNLRQLKVFTDSFLHSIVNIQETVKSDICVGVEVCFSSGHMNDIAHPEGYRGW